MRYLRNNTACRVTVGPFYDKTDGVTPEVALTVTACKLTFVVDDANVPTLVLDTNPTASGGSNDMIHISGDDAGFYDLELAAANVNYFGRAMLAITDAATHCPVFHEFMIVPANVYDSVILGTDLLDTSTVQWTGTNVATPDTNGYPKVTLKVGTGTGEVNLVSGRVPVRAPITKNTALANFPFSMTDSTNHNPMTGLTVTATRSIDGGSFSAGTIANMTEVASGAYQCDLGAGDLNGDTIIFRFTATGADDLLLTIVPAP